ncbi:DUF1643 domain-containing protein [Paenibacillus macerans]|uniref:DUF1643 domain-containing protein n=1 Tax=Paenibacillus macerans TaxID=44252 RepID=A0A6N8EU60_PAEMA|nr:DUF1643 domain-containing protein [Paenibacillus macerans]MEC0136712.1 DUF1643 domain-containing protein [Paenibacillus macerans]MED4955987.1 DUF1643 domain-containing protein [Paenibacillus macerans]MUG21798.1 DUF1643 domain-containing protein [Paenibacillus macerans]
MKMDAVFDSTRRYRYLLSRIWDDSLPKVLYVMLNPSTADNSEEDRTSSQCLYFAKKFGYGSLEVVNLYALISTDPKQLKFEFDPIGTENDKFILEAAGRAKTIVVAWGEKHFINQRHNKVARLLTSEGHQLHCLGIAKSEHPRHPSRMSHSIESLTLYSTEEYLRKLHTPPKVIAIVPTVTDRKLKSREGYDSNTGSDYHFHKDVMDDEY